MVITFTVDAPPSANIMYRAVPGKVLKSAEYRNWLKSAAVDFFQQRGIIAMLDGPTLVTIEAQPKDHRLRDVDNYIKPCLDLLEVVGLIKNDRDVTSIYAYRNAPRSGLHQVTISVQTIGQAPHGNSQNPL